MQTAAYLIEEKAAFASFKYTWNCPGKMEGFIMRHGIIRSTSNVQQSGLRLPARTLPATLTLLFVAFALILSACGGGSTTGPNTGGGGSVKTGGKLSVGLP